MSDGITHNSSFGNLLHIDESFQDFFSKSYLMSLRYRRAVFYPSGLPCVSGLSPLSLRRFRGGPLPEPQLRLLSLPLPDPLRGFRSAL